MVSAADILKKHKLRVTTMRQNVINIFLKAGNALSSADVESQLIDSDRITLYRTLKSFEERGIIHKAIDGTIVQKYALCEAQCDHVHHNDHHVHFRCEACENTFCVEGVSIPQVNLPEGFVVKQKDMVISGICQKCQ